MSTPAITASRPYRCHRCGAASYGRVIERGADGAMASAGGFRCSGCAAVFAALSEWHGGPTGVTARWRDDRAGVIASNNT